MKKEIKTILVFVVLSLICAVPMFGQTATPSGPCINHGDVDFSGGLTAGDAQMTFNIVLGFIVPTPEEFCAADCNASESITAEDAQTIFLSVLSLDDCVDPIPTDTPTPSPTVTPTATATPVPAYAVDNIVGNMHYVPAGTFTQGSPDGSGSEPAEIGRGNDEDQFEHTLSRDFLVMETEISRQMWDDLMNAQPELPSDPSDLTASAGMDQPAQQVTWYENILFANLLSLNNGFPRCYYADADFTIPIDGTNYTDGSVFWKKDATGYRLPSEGEWEYFCRAETTGPFYCPENNYTATTYTDCDMNNWTAPNSNEMLLTHGVFCRGVNGPTEPVDSMGANPWNLKGLIGNVYEFCFDKSVDYPTEPQVDYVGTGATQWRAMRSGCFANIPRSVRSACRWSTPPDNRSSYIGFRLVRTLPFTGAHIATDPVVGNLRYFPGGTFLQGGLPDYYCGTQQNFTHTLTRQFVAMETEFTRQMWFEVRYALGSSVVPGDPSFYETSPTHDHPVSHCNWYMAAVMANFLSIVRGYEVCYYVDEALTEPLDADNLFNGSYYWDESADGYRLPTEGEWEYMCRAGTTGPFYCDEPAWSVYNCSNCDPGVLPVLEQYAVFCQNPAETTSAIPGTRLSNPWGLLDMHGNMSEWCWDFYDNDYPTGSMTDYTGPETGVERVSRGGAWTSETNFAPAHVMSAYRRDFDPSAWNSGMGFRLVRTLE